MKSGDRIYKHIKEMLADKNWTAAKIFLWGKSGLMISFNLRVVDDWVSDLVFETETVKGCNSWEAAGECLRFRKKFASCACVFELDTSEVTEIEVHADIVLRYDMSERRA